MISADERRKFPRMVVDCKVAYRDENGTTDDVNRTINLSANGILFNAVQSLNVGAQLEVNVVPFNNVTPPLHAMIEVVRSRYDDDCEQYEVAASIKQIIQ
ncbi:MAG: PilZ domain-containing protein [Gammaproteobacteria bacterium]|nr:PilZ domain-containing protein [Gammaproteobacteria bacterium]